MVTIIVILAVLLFLAVLLLLPIRLKIFARYENRSLVEEYLLKYGIIKIIDSNKPKKEKKKKDKPSKQGTEEKKKRSTGEVVSFVRKNKEPIKRLVKSIVRYATKSLVRVERFKINGKIGLEDAMDTALVYGASSAFLFNTLGIMDKGMRISGIEISFMPDFKQSAIFIEFECIIMTRLYNVFCLAVIVLFHGLPLIRKRGDFKNGKSN